MNGFLALNLLGELRKAGFVCDMVTVETIVKTHDYEPSSAKQEVTMELVIRVYERSEDLLKFDVIKELLREPAYYDSGAVVQRLIDKIRAGEIKND